MAVFKRILCPLDFSTTSTKAMLFAERLVGELGGELILLHAFDRPSNNEASGRTEPADPEVKRQLDAVVPTDADISVRRVLHVGLAGEVICWVAQDQTCDLIVMGTHGRGGVRHLLLGSVAEHVLRHARQPVVVVRDAPADEPPLPEPQVIPLPPAQWM